MPHTDKTLGKALGAALEDFRTATSYDALWDALHRHLEKYGGLRVMYGAKAVLGAPQPPHIFRCSYAEDYLKQKDENGGLEADYYVQAVQREQGPILWSDARRLVDLTPKMHSSLQVDWVYKMKAGVSLSTRFNHNQSGGGFGLHAPDMNPAEFDRIWQEHGAVIQAICHGFDTRVREDWVHDILPLSDHQRECLSELAKGRKAKEVAHRLGLSTKALERREKKSWDLLKATNATQAVVNAMAFGLLTARTRP